jgi:hypothetical protein
MGEKKGDKRNVCLGYKTAESKVHGTPRIMHDNAAAITKRFNRIFSQDRYTQKITGK